MTTAWPDEPSLYPYAAQAGWPAQKALVLAPHPDDEVLGCGGLIAALAARGAEVHVVIATDGAGAGDAGVREQESRAAAQVLAGDGRLPRLDFWRLADRALADEPTLLPRLEHLLAASDAELVLLPSPLEIHPDHRALCLAALQAALRVGGAADLYGYEVGQPLMADRLVDITAQVERKRAALRCFASQLALQPYDEQLLALNRYRAYTLGNAVTHAEAFQRLDRHPASTVVQGLCDDLARRLRLRYGAA